MTRGDDNIVPATDDGIARAARILRNGGLVAFSTETVYGLGADATNDSAVARIFEAKARPRFNPLIVHVANRDAATALAVFNEPAEDLAARFWPGALTIVLPKRPACPLSRLVSAGLNSVAVRCPRHATAAALLRATGRPIAAPSANRSGKLSPTTAAHVAEDLGTSVDLILDGGACPVGVESTVIDLSNGSPRLLRPGGVTVEEITACIGSLGKPTKGPVKSPGMLSQHYAPDIPLRLNAHQVAADEALLAFGSDIPDGAAATRNLSPTGDLVEAAANLFAALHDLNRRDYGGIAVTPIPNRGLGRAINDRLRRAQRGSKS